MVDATADSATQTVHLPRFGTCTYAETDTLVFPWGLPGFDDLRTFLVLTLESQSHIIWLQSLEDFSVALPLADPWTFFPDYDPKLPSFARVSLDLEKPEDFTVLAVTVGTDGGGMFMNLMAPVVVNLKSRIARQVALENSGYTVAMPVQLIDEPPAAAEAGEAGAVPE